MKRIFSLLLILCCIQANAKNKDVASVFYVSTTGHDNTGDGSVGNPWASLHKAGSVVSAGSLIHVFAGSYTEPLRDSLATGVSLEGDGLTTIIHLTYFDSSIHDAGLYLNSPAEGTSGNQSISNIWFDGNNDACYIGLLIRARSNVSVHDCKFTGFSHGAVFFDGKTETFGPPSTFSTNNQLYNDTVIDCMRGHVDAEPGWGSIAFAGQKNVNAYNNYLANNGRATGLNGDLFGMVEGYNGGFNIYNNTFVKTFVSEGNSNNIMIENWHDLGGMHVYGNTFLGGGVAIDIALDGANKGTSAYSWLIENNNFTMRVQYASFPTEQYSGTAMGVQFETQNPHAGYAIVRNNHFHKLGVAIQFATHTGEVDRNIQIYGNLADSIGYGNGGGTGMINFLLADTSTTKVDSVSIDNNTLIGWHAKAGIYFNLASGGTNNVDTLYLRNNFINGVIGGGGSVYGYITYFGSKNLNHFYNQHNYAYGNTNGTTIYQSSYTGSVTNYTSTALLNSPPLFNLDFTLQTGSPAIDEGLNIGYPYSGLAPDIGAFEKSASNIYPVANAGIDFSITAPQTVIDLQGSGSDADGTITSYSWAKISGPGTTTLTNPTSAHAMASGLQVGTYLFRLTVTDNMGAPGTDDITVTVTPAPVTSVQIQSFIITNSLGQKIYQ